jgi:hypothetical protein
LTYKKAAKNFAEYFKPPEAESEAEKTPKNLELSDDETNKMAAIYNLDSLLEQKSHEYSSINDVGTILNESKLDIQSLAAGVDNEPITESAFAPSKESEKPAPEPTKEESSGGNLSPEAIAALLESAEQAEAAEETA